MSDGWRYPKLIAHRGAGKEAPENTLAAMRFGALCTYAMFEFDVKLSADNVLALMHDDTLERTTNGEGAFARKSWSELSQLDAGGWHSHAFVGEPIPTFANVAAFCRSNAIAVNAEIKACPGRELETGRAVARACAQLWQSADVPPLLSSFSEMALAAAREAVPDLPRALLLDKLPSDWLQRAQYLDCSGVNFNWKVLTPDVVRIAHENGLTVACYTCNDGDAVRALFAMRVDGVITDAVRALTP